MPPRYIQYERYLASAEWKAFTSTLVSAGAKCLGCAFPSGVIQFHHLNYESLGSETPRDVIPLCRDCHERVHDFLARRFPRASRGATARFTSRLWCDIFSTTETLNGAIARTGWIELFSQCFPDRAANKSKKLTRKEKKQNKILFEMRLDRAYHAKHCDNGVSDQHRS